eukprot:CAMPEP_0115227980 /NCGR_PEP_ID=MMETSP0270-20121206/31429_1 /TAXON_ID=71861 /ORGANISM="Scrippsiella trochoidea, Strain CCMP3099" /LENGTH=53 /DNA_ID=CAMNT_0002642457 /DNA_START=1257 /DNA_END=1414 /DNA_ORIENTATION=-
MSLAKTAAEVIKQLTWQAAKPQTLRGTHSLACARSRDLMPTTRMREGLVPEMA